MPDERRKALSRFEHDSQLRFRSVELLDLAFCHRSRCNEDPGHNGSNERLEFLGDSVLGLVVADYLYGALPDKPEGDLAKIKSFVVSEDSLADVALALKVPDYLVIGKGEEHSGGRQKRAILADALEAVIGACYLDQGIEEARRFVLRFFVPEIDKVIAGRHRKDFKTLLQERVQKQLKTYPQYVLVRKAGPDHARTFWIEVHVGERRFGPAEGHNKKEAEQKAAAIAYGELFGAD